MNIETVLLCVGTIVTVLGTGVTVISLTYGFLRNFKQDVQASFVQIDKHLDRLDDEQKVARLRTDHLYEMLCKLMHEVKRS